MFIDAKLKHCVPMVVYNRYGSSHSVHALMMALPVLEPPSMSMKACGIFPKPSVQVSFTLILPFA